MVRIVPSDVLVFFFSCHKSFISLIDRSSLGLDPPLGPADPLSEAQGSVFLIIGGAQHSSESHKIDHFEAV